MKFLGLLQPVPPYDFHLSIRMARFHSVLDTLRDDEYWRALDIQGAVALVRVISQGTPQAPQLAVYRAAATGPVDDALLLRRVRDLLGVAADMRPFYEHARHDAVLWPLVEPLYGLRHVRAASLFEALMTTIIEQQIALNMAQRGERWLIQWTGGRITHEGETYYTFPQPAAIAAASVDDLLELRITRIRMRVMLDVARQIVAGQINPEALQTADAIQQALLQVRGIGQWTAAWTVIRTLGEYPYISENDVALQAAVNHYYYQQRGRVAPQVVRQTLAPYGDFAGAAAFHILMQWGLAKYGG